MTCIGNSVLYGGSGGEGRVRGPTSVALKVVKLLQWIGHQQWTIV